MHIEALDKSHAKETHLLFAFEVPTSTCVDRQVCALVVGRNQLAVLVTYVLATLILINTSDVGALFADIIFHSHLDSDIR